MRERGFVSALSAAGIKLESAALRRVPATAAGGQTGMHALLAMPDRPSAVFCSNDLVAAGALKVCSLEKVEVPHEMSIVGCDDIELASLLIPSLTTVAIPARELGARAARLLLQGLTGSSPESRTLQTAHSGQLHPASLCGEQRRRPVETTEVELDA
jgi:Transcriptional regulators